MNSKCQGVCFFNNSKPKESLRENLLVILYSPREVHLETLIIC